MKIERFVDPKQVKEDVSFTEAMLNEAMLEQSALMSYYGELATKAQSQVDRAKMMTEITEAKVGRDARRAAADDGKKVTEKQLEQEVSLNTEVIKLRRAVIEARSIYEGLRATVEALKAKKDMIIQIGVRHRMELETQGRILVRKEKEGEGKDRVGGTIERLKDRVANSA